MSQRIVVTGTDTGIGKTIFSAGLANLLDAHYWKPIQAGLDGETDAEVVAKLGGLSADRIMPELHRLRTPASLAVTLCRGEIFDAHYSKDRTRTFFHSSSYTAKSSRLCRRECELGSLG